MFKQTGWFAGALIVLMPVLVIFLLGVQVAHGQVRARLEVYQAIPEIETLADLQVVEPKQIIIVHGQLAPLENRQPNDLLVFQERPTDGREVRFQEEFPLVFPALTITLPDGELSIEPGEAEERTIQGELHSFPLGDRTLTGFRAGDAVNIQGRWEPPILSEASNITSIRHSAVIAELESRLAIVAWVRNGLGLITLVSVVLFVRAARQAKLAPPAEEAPSYA
jgi:hypothetical protein